MRRAPQPRRPGALSLRARLGPGADQANGAHNQAELAFLGAKALSGAAGEATLPSADRARQQWTEKLPVLGIEAPHLYLF